MNKRFFALLIFGFIIFTIIPNAYSYTPWIPPTNSIERIVTSNSTVKANNYSAPFIFKGTNGLTVTGSDISKTIYLSAPSGVLPPTTSCPANYGFVSYNQTSNLFTCKLLNQTGSGTGVQSLNALVGALTIAGVAGNTTVTNSGGGILTINTAYNIVTTGLSAQTISKALTINNLILGGQMNINGNTMKSSGHVYSWPANTGTVCLTNQTSSCGTSTSSTYDTIQNIGSGQGSIYAGNTTKTNFQFKTLKQGSNIQITNNTNDLTLAVTGLLSSAILSINNDASSAQTLTVIGSGSIADNGGGSHVITTKTYQNNTGTSLGNGLAIYTGMSGSALQIRSLSLGSGLSSSGTNSSTIVLSNTVSGTIINSQNTGHASNSIGTLATFSSTTIKGRNMTGSSPISITKTNDTDISISCSTCLISALVNSQNIGKGTGSIGFLSTPTSTLIKSKNATAGTGISLAGNTTDITFTNSGVTSIAVTAGNLTTTGSTGAITLNTGNNLGYLAKSQTWTSTNTHTGIIDLKNTGTLKSSSSGIIIRNPANTFTTTLTNSAITANRTLNIPLTTQTETIAVQPTLNSTTPSDPTGTTSTSGVMTGMLAGFTPTVTGRIQIIIEGDLSSLLAADGAKVDARYGTGTSPTNGAALTGTVCGKAVQVTAVNAAANLVPFALTCQVTGLTVGTHIWIELGQYAVSASTASVKNIAVSIMEI